MNYDYSRYRPARWHVPVSETRMHDETERIDLHAWPVNRAANDDDGQAFQLTELAAPAPATPPWGGFDTFLRRSLMIVANILLWGLFVTIVAAVIGGAAVISNLTGDTGDTGTFAPHVVDNNGPCDPTGENPDAVAC